ncbi:MAG: transglutaminase family protein [Candidatus Acidiferrum sp.]
MNRYRLVHSTEFLYDGAVSESYNEVRLRPIDDDLQSCLSFRLVTSPPSRGASFRDSYGNWIHQFNILPDHRRLKIEAESVVLAHEAAEVSRPAATLADLDAQRNDLFEEHYDFVAPSGFVPYLQGLEEILHACEGGSDGTVLGFTQAVSTYIHMNFKYVKGATHVHSSVRDSLAVNAGVCQDFAHLLLGVVRMRGVPARYVSGYLVPGDASGTDTKQEEVIGGQASHAWAEVFVPGSGWSAFDPTLGKPVGIRHIRVAYGRDYGDVPPVRGVYKGRAGQHLSVDVCVRPALDGEGREQLTETSEGPHEPPQMAELPQQNSQQ